MSSKGWFNLEAVGGTIPETQFFEGDSAFSSLGLTRTQRLYGFVARYVVVVVVIPSFIRYVRFLLLFFFPLSVAFKGLVRCSVLLVRVISNLLFDE
jgi:hypothetical protein